MVVPMNEAIGNFCEFTGADNETARLFIRGNDGDLEKAVNEFFLNPNPRRYEEQLNWSEEAFREGEPYGPHPPEDLAFQVMEVSDSYANLKPLVAPSRPPSQIGHGSVQYTEDASYPKQEFQGERVAIERSLEPQETGRIEPGGKEYLPDPEPSARARTKDEPAFIRPSPRHDFLPSIIPILHSIPKCRERLLARDDVIPDYGFNDKWWQGQRVEMDNVIPSEQGIHNADDLAVIFETQRLMAFLDETKRSYGSISPLAGLRVVQNTTNTVWSERTFLEKYLIAWDSASEITESEDVQDFEDHLFRSTIITRNSGTTDWQQRPKWVFKISFRGLAEDATIYDALDRSFEHQTDNSFWAESFAPVLPIVVSADFRGGVKLRGGIPKLLFVDRYLAENASVEIEYWNRIRVELEKAEGLESKLLRLKKPPTAQTRDTTEAVDLIDASMRFLASTSQTENERNPLQGNEKYIERAISVLRGLDISKRMVEVKLEELEQQKESIKARLGTLNSIFTPGTDDTASQLKHPYYLSGVARSFSGAHLVTYFKFPARNAIKDAGGGDAPEWWRTGYEIQSGSPIITKAQVTEEEVLAATGDYRGETLLLYVDKDLHESSIRSALPGQLKEFVEKDNELFSHELDKTAPPMVIEGQAVDDTEDTMMNDMSGTDARDVVISGAEELQESEDWENVQLMDGPGPTINSRESIG